MGVRCLAIVAAVPIVAVLAAPAGAAACSCAPLEPGAAMRNADAAIVGRLIEVIPRGHQAADFRYRVQRVRKSGRGLARGRMASVRANSSGAACGLPTGVDRRYGLLLFWDEGRWTSNLCNLVEPRVLKCDS